MKKKVLIIGKGDRAQKTIIPAIKSMGEKYEIIGIATKHSDPIEKFMNIYFDLIFVAVTLQEVPKVLINLQKFKHKSFTLYLDTPVLTFYHFPFLLYLKKFPKVLVSEEHPYLPVIKRMKKEITSEKIGNVYEIKFHHFGYKYHALAMLKYLFGEKSVSKVVTKKSDDGENEVRFYFSKDRVGVVTEPQVYTKGWYEIVGDKGKRVGKVSKDFRKEKIEAFPKMIIDSKYGPWEGFMDQIITQSSDKLGIFYGKLIS